MALWARIFTFNFIEPAIKFRIVLKLFRIKKNADAVTFKLVIYIYCIPAQIPNFQPSVTNGTQCQHLHRIRKTAAGFTDNIKKYIRFHLLHGHSHHFNANNYPWSGVSMKITDELQGFFISIFLAFITVAPGSNFDNFSEILVSCTRFSFLYFYNTTLKRYGYILLENNIIQTDTF